MTKIIVVYDAGAADLREIHTGLSRLGTVVYTSPTPPSPQLAALLGQFGEVLAIDDVARIRPDAVLTFSERWLRLTAELTDRLGLPGHTPATAGLLTDKRAQRARLRSAGVDRLRTATIAGPDDWPAAVAAVGLPAVLKPVHGEGSSRTYLIEDSSTGGELAGAVAGLAGGGRESAGVGVREPTVSGVGEPAVSGVRESAALGVRGLGALGVRELAGGGGFQLEEYLAGRDCAPYGDFVSVESAVSQGRVTHLAVTGKFPLLPPFRESGHFWPAVLNDGEHEQIVDLAGRALNALDIHTGIAHTEIKLTRHGPRIIEVNGRLGGLINELATRATGTDLVELAGRLALGEQVSPEPLKVDGTHFLHVHPSPLFEYRLLEVRGITEVRRLPGITGYRRIVPPNRIVERDVMTRPMDVLTGRTSGPEEMLRVLAQARHALTFVFEVDGRRVEVPADDLA